MTDIASIIVVALVVLYSAYRGVRYYGENTTVEQYFLMGRTLPQDALGATFVATNISVSTVVLALGTVGYQYGFWAVALLTITWIAGLELFLWVAQKPRLAQYLATGTTIHDFLGQTYDHAGRNRIRTTAAILTIGVFWGTLGVEFLAATVLFRRLLGTPSPTLIGFIIAAAVVLYCLYGGFRGATLVDTPRLVLVVMGFALLLGGGVLIPDSAIVAKSIGFTTLARLDPLWIVAIILTFIPFQLSAMDMWQRCIAAGGEQTTIRRGLRRAIVWYALWLVPGLLGALGHTLGVVPATPNEVSLDVIARLVAMAPDSVIWQATMAVAQPIIFGALVATLLSVADGILIALAFAFIHDVYLPWHRKQALDFDSKEEREAHILSASRWWTGVLGFAAVLVVLAGLWAAALYDLIVAVFSLQILLFWPAIAGVLATKRDLTARATLGFWALIFGVVAAISCIVGGVITKDVTVLNAAPIAGFVVTGTAWLFVVFTAPRRVATE